MQLANQSGEPDQQTSPYLRAALIDSLFETPAPMLTGLVFGAGSAAMTALKTGEALIWACVALLVVACIVRGLVLLLYRVREKTLTTAEAARWKKYHQTGA